MSLDANEVRVAGAGHVYAAPEGTALPAGLAVLDPEWVELGYVTTDGVAFTFSRETEDLDAWQGDKIRVLTTREPATIAFALMETSADVIVLAFGGGEVTEPESGIFRYVPARGENAIRSLVIEFSDEALDYRYVVPRAQVEGDVSFTLTRAGAVTYPLTFGLLENDPKYVILSNDPAMGGGALPGTVGEGGETAVAAIGATAPAPVGSKNSLWIDSDDLKIHISDGSVYADSTQVLATLPPAASVGTADPSAGAGLAGTTNSVFFQNTGSNYEVWIKGAGAATDWTNANKDIPLNP